MGLLDDAASAISVRSSHSKKSRSHKSSSHRHRSRSRSRGHHSSATGGAGGALGGIAASLFGTGGGNDHKHHTSSSSDSDRRKKKHSSTSRSIFGTDHDTYKKHSASRPSFFGIPTGNHSNSGRSPSYYKRSPRPNFVTRVVKRLKRLLRDLVYYAKRHPLKVFMLVVMPLVTGGFLTALLAKFGLKLPGVLTQMIGLAGRAASGDGIGAVGEAVKMASGGGGGMGNVARASVSVERGRDFGGGSWERRSVERDIVGSVGAGGGGMGWGTLAAVGKFFS